eukprot:CAMPEP_0170536646 /NCGR_PEP_ID=MMETSP0209-20121228/102261_1 /TAXON_ID=665100 ORGANISM="Litonotus pictus, Strain P1" /NCGR_SAMPLE_ID=MMETSP0209 /ASSEMBLY_ACC=CAM_ASM_000301 /LENGTH=599 /DNA_ID=CAMNT_0010838029 /DNA_START=1545 /DNA_END=3341 /DNA_ORIENTATION=-
MNFFDLYTEFSKYTSIKQQELIEFNKEIEDFYRKQNGFCGPLEESLFRIEKGVKGLFYEEYSKYREADFYVSTARNTFQKKLRDYFSERHLNTRPIDKVFANGTVNYDVLLSVVEELKKKILKSVDYSIFEENTIISSMNLFKDVILPDMSWNPNANSIAITSFTLQNEVRSMREIKPFYSHLMVQATEEYLREATQERPFILSRGNTIGTGHYGFHWLGDNKSTFQSMKESIAGIYNYQIFGFSLVGADICGFDSQPSTLNCIYWTSLGSFYPFARNHSHRDFKLQFPFNFPYHLESMNRILKLRYKLLRYLYTCLFFMSSEGGSCFKPYFTSIEYYNEHLMTDSIIEDYFLFGDSIVIVPMLSDLESTVNVILEKANYFSLTSSKIEISKKLFTKESRVDNSFNKENNAKANAPVLGKITLNYLSYKESIKVLLKEGSIIPFSSANEEDIFSSKQIQESLTSLKISLDSKRRATGRVVFDDGKSLDTIKSGLFIHVDMRFRKDTLYFKFVNKRNSLYNISNKKTNIKTLVYPFEDINLNQIELVGLKEEVKCVKVSLYSEQTEDVDEYVLKNLFKEGSDLISYYGRDNIIVIDFPSW